MIFPFLGSDASQRVFRPEVVLDSSWFTLFQRLTPDTARRCESIVPQACERPTLSVLVEGNATASLATMHNCLDDMTGKED
jgi:hypothetical protein